MRLQHHTSARDTTLCTDGVLLLLLDHTVFHKGFLPVRDLTWGDICTVCAARVDTAGGSSGPVVQPAQSSVAAAAPAPTHPGRAATATQNHRASSAPTAPGKGLAYAAINSSAELHSPSLEKM